MSADCEIPVEWQYGLDGSMAESEACLSRSLSSCSLQNWDGPLFQFSDSGAFPTQFVEMLRSLSYEASLPTEQFETKEEINYSTGFIDWSHEEIDMQIYEDVLAESEIDHKKRKSQDPPTTPSHPAAVQQDNRKRVKLEPRQSISVAQNVSIEPRPFMIGEAPALLCGIDCFLSSVNTYLSKRASIPNYDEMLWAKLPPVEVKKKAVKIPRRARDKARDPHADPTPRQLAYRRRLTCKGKFVSKKQLQLLDETEDSLSISSGGDETYISDIENNFELVNTTTKDTSSAGATASVNANYYTPQWQQHPPNVPMVPVDTEELDDEEADENLDFDIDWDIDLE